MTIKVSFSSSVENELRELIKDSKLIGEIDLRLTGQNFLNARGEIDRIVRKYGKGYINHIVEEGIIASYAIMLAGLAFSLYKDGTFWPHVRSEDQSDFEKLPFYKSDNDNRRYGSVFQQCLSLLKKDTFADEIVAENGLAFLGPILLHAGLPASTVTDVWLLLLREFSEGTSNSSELVTNLRQDKAKIQYLDKPAQRFINYGGNFVVDLFQRMLNVIEDKPRFSKDEIEVVGLEFGLPPLYLEKLMSVDSELSSKKLISLPVPKLMFDEFSLDGPYIELPNLRKEVSRGQWRIRGAVAASENPIYVVDTSYTHPRQIFLRPDRSWKVSIETQDNRSRNSSFQVAANGKALLFDAVSGDYIHPRTAIKSSEVILIAHKEIGFSGSIGANKFQLDLINLPRIGGDWNEWNEYRIRVTEIEKLQFLKSTDGNEELLDELLVNKSAQTAELIGDSIDAFKDLDGGRVFSKIPFLKFSSDTPLEKLSMRIRFSDGRVSVGLKLSEMCNDDGLVDFSKHVHDGLASLTLFVQGAQLGSDFNTRLVVVPNLKFEVEDKIFSPTELVKGIIIYENSQQELVFYDGEDYKQVQLSDALTTIHLGLKISRLTHCVRVKNEELEFGSKVKTITKEKFIARDVSQIVARCYKKTFFRLHIEDSKQRTIASSAITETLGLDNRVTFDLLSFIDDVNNTPSQLLTVFLYLDTRKVELLKIVTQYSVQFSEISVVEFGADKSDSKIFLSFSESHKLGDREVVIRNIRNSWQDDLHLKIQDNSEESVLLDVPKLKPGNYVVGIRSGEAEPIFNGFFHAGSDDDYNDYVSSLAATSPEAVAELICNGVHSRHELLEESFMAKLASMLLVLLANISKARAFQDFLVIDLAVARLLDERFGGKPFIGWWFTSLSRNPGINCMTVDQILICAFKTLTSCPLDAAIASTYRDDIWSLSRFFGAAIDMLDRQDPESRRVWLQIVENVDEIDTAFKISQPGRHHDIYSHAELKELLEKTNIVGQADLSALPPILSPNGFKRAFYSYLIRNYEGSDVSTENKTANQARIWSKSEEVKTVSRYVNKLSEEELEYYNVTLPRADLDSKYNVVSQVCAFSFLSMTYQQDVVKSKIDQRAAALLTQVYEFAPELVEFFLLIALVRRRFGLR